MRDRRWVPGLFVLVVLLAVSGALGLLPARRSGCLWAAQDTAATVQEAPLFVRVRAGDTLGGLARRFGSTVARLRADNGLHGDRIHPGQRLLLGAATRPHGARAGAFRARPPLRGANASRLVTAFGRQASARNARVVQRNTGIELAASRGEEVVAAAPGIVRFLSPLEGLGHVAIVEHAGGYRTVYCPLDADRLAAEVGEAVREGQPLGSVGAPRWSERVLLRFEVRRGDTPVDPVPYLGW